MATIKQYCDAVMKSYLLTYVMIRMDAEGRRKEASSLQDYVEKQLQALERSYSKTSMEFEQIVAMNHEWIRCLRRRMHSEFMVDYTVCKS